MPIDNPVLPSYLLNVPNPAEQLQKSLQAGFQIGQQQQQAQAAQDAHAISLQTQQSNDIAAKQQALQQQQIQDFRQDMAANNANPTPGGTQAIIAKYPQFLSQTTGSAKAISEDQAKQLGAIHISGLKGARDVQADQIKQLATSYLNTQDPQQQAYGQSLMAGLKLQASNPGVYDAIIGHKIAEAIGGEEYSKQYGGVAKLPAEIAAGQSDAAIKALDAKHEEEKLTDAHKAALAAALASGATTAEKNQAIALGNRTLNFKVREAGAAADLAEANAKKALRDSSGLPDEGKKQYAEAYQDFGTANAAVKQSAILSNQIRTQGMAAGVPAVINKTWHQISGTPDADARLNQSLSQLTNSSILGDAKALGKITPAEIELLQKQRPDDNASASDKADWLDAYGKAMAFKRDQAQEKADYINANGDLTPAKKNININGKKYPIGSPPPGLDAATQQGATPAKMGPVLQSQVQRAQAHLATLDPKSPEAIKISAVLKSMGV